MAKPNNTHYQRVAIENVCPAVDGGRFPAKRVLGDTVVVEADIFADGHDVLRAVFLWKHQGSKRWHETAMRTLGNDRWQGSFVVSKLGMYQFSLFAWVDTFQTWQQQFEKRVEANQDVSVDLQIGADLLEQAATQCKTKQAAKKINEWSLLLQGTDKIETRTQAALSHELRDFMAQHGPRQHATRSSKDYTILVDPKIAACSAWYEMFPRSCAKMPLFRVPEVRTEAKTPLPKTEIGPNVKIPETHGTFKDVEARLPYIADMGFDVLYLPPIHPIGHTFRKGKNNVTTPEPGAVGCPWAIGNEQGGHKAIHPELGTFQDFEQLVNKAKDLELHVALDIAFQTSPDHPYVQTHPEWFRKRPDGTIQYAENPPKKYQDIYPFDFETPAAKELWAELKSIFDFWIDKGITIFRVDNPHTKPFVFWEWCIGEIKRDHPEVIFLAEAFTRPKIMYELAKLGFSQSYTYFPWRTQKQEIAEYATELAHTKVREFFRPNHWVNTPDILIAYLQQGERAAFAIRLTLAATIGTNYGMYGPAFELLEHQPLHEGSEEYLNSEKYQLRFWNLDHAESLRPIIKKMNQLRHENPALQQPHNIMFHEIDNKQILCFSKTCFEQNNVLLIVVNVDPENTQTGWTDLDMSILAMEDDSEFQVLDLLSDKAYTWKGKRNYVGLDPKVMPAHVFRVQQKQ